MTPQPSLSISIRQSKQKDKCRIMILLCMVIKSKWLFITERDVLNLILQIYFTQCDNIWHLRMKVKLPPFALQHLNKDCKLYPRYNLVTKQLGVTFNIYNWPWILHWNWKQKMKSIPWTLSETFMKNTP